MSKTGVNLDGLRKGLSRDILDLKEIIESVLSKETYSEDNLKQSMDAVIQSSNVLNCVYNDEIDNFNDISHINIDWLED